MSHMTTTTPLIIETDRGPCISGRRTTVYVILDHLNSGCDREFIKEHLLLSDQQLDAAVDYIQLHREEVERDYAHILRRTEERKTHYEKLYRERAPYDPNLPMEERVMRMRRDLTEKKAAVSLRDDHQNLA
ncbi:MAG: DUF433 domain-containing protein [Deltaproteobacteria bacterium]|nr:DUF433 domain-containing protein [Deltaproteobacteria bacterium]